MYHCTACGTEVTLENPTHVCIDVRRQQGRPIGAETMYVVRRPKSKQETVEGYMKTFGSRAKKN